MCNKFNLGRIVMTRGVAERLESDTEFAKFCYAALERYQGCDWGDLKHDDKMINDAALEPGREERIFAAYRQPGMGTKLLIITEWDRSATTLLFPEEY